MGQTFKELSKKHWCIADETTLKEVTFEQIRIGTLQRIADATELMAKNYSNLISEVADLRDENKRLNNALNAEKSAKSRLKNKINQTQKEVCEDMSLCLTAGRLLKKSNMSYTTSRMF